LGKKKAIKGALKAAAVKEAAKVRREVIKQAQTKKEFKKSMSKKKKAAKKALVTPLSEFQNEALELETGTGNVMVDAMPDDANGGNADGNEFLEYWSD